MDLSQHNMIVNFIWSIADDCLRDVYVRGKYRDVILPMIVIRRIDALLEPTKAVVLKLKEQLDKAKVANQNPALCQAAKQAFYNTSPFLLRDLKSRTSQQKLKADFESYLDGFSHNVKEILEKFQFRNQKRVINIIIYKAALSIISFSTGLYCRHWFSHQVSHFHYSYIIMTIDLKIGKFSISGVYAMNQFYDSPLF